jgi:hypothetical protein
MGKHVGARRSKTLSPDLQIAVSAIGVDDHQANASRSALGEEIYTPRTNAVAE